MNRSFLCPYISNIQLCPELSGMNTGESFEIHICRLPAPAIVPTASCWGRLMGVPDTSARTRSMQTGSNAKALRDFIIL